MKITGIISEFSPFHNGHAHLLDEVRKRGADIIICVMSGSITQRGDAAVFDKYTRAKTAVMNGADLVFELPYPYSASSAEYFAEAGEYILHSLGANAIGFGSESADPGFINNTAYLQMSEEYIDEYRTLCRNGNGNAYAHQLAYRRLTGTDCVLSPNDILAVEYVKTNIKNGYRFSFDIVKRAGADYNEGLIPEEIYQSASALRKLIYDNDIRSIYKYIPKNAADAYLTEIYSGFFSLGFGNNGRNILTSLRLLDKSDRDDCGLDNLILKSSHKAVSYGELLDLCVASGCTHARIKREIISLLTGADETAVRSKPLYTQLLSFNKKGREYLNSIRRNTGISIITKPADKYGVNGGGRQNMLEDKAEALWTMTLKKAETSDVLTRMKPFMAE